MYMKTGVIVGYRYKVYYESSLLHEDDEVFDEEEDAIEDAKEYIERKRNDWENDGAWTEDDSEDDFDIVIEDVVEEE